MSEHGLIENWALHAYVDGELDAAGRISVEKLLAENSAARASVESYMRQKQALKQAYDEVLSEPVPSNFATALAARGSWADRPLLQMAAAVLLLLAGGLGGWFLAQGSGGNRMVSLADDAIVAHSVFAAEVRHPVEVSATEKDHLQTWLSKRVGAPFVIPDLSAEGYTLLGGRLLAAERGAAAQLMYEDQDKRRITVFLTSNPGNTETALRVEEKGKLVACYWLDGPLGFALAGEMDRASMMRLAHVVYDKFDG